MKISESFYNAKVASEEGQLESLKLRKKKQNDRNLETNHDKTFPSVRRQ